MTLLDTAGCFSLLLITMAENEALGTTCDQTVPANRKNDCDVVPSAFKQREEAVLLCAGACCHGERRFVLHSEREVEPSGRVGAEPLGGVQKDQHICWKLS